MTQPTTTQPLGALTALLQSAHAAVYGYPVVGARLTIPSQITLARTLEATHRQQRDDLTAQITALGQSPIPAAPIYLPPAPVTDLVSALRYAVALEQNCAAAYRYLLTVTVGADVLASSALRQQALTGLSASAINAWQWRALLTPTTPTVALPGS